MWSLIKGAFWFSLVLLLLPLFDSAEKKDVATAPAVELGSAVSAASEALAYMTSICAEKPDVCIEGAKAMEAIGHRARNGARVAYDFLDDKLAATDKAEKPDPEDAALKTSSIPVPAKRPEQ